MSNQRKVVPSWMRTASKIGLGMGLFFGITGALTHDWPVVAGMTAMVILQIAALATTKTKE